MSHTPSLISPHSPHSHNKHRLWQGKELGGPLKYCSTAPSCSYVCNSMGGPVEPPPGNMAYDLPQSQIQKGAGSNVVALGDITMGTYRHRSLLYKVSDMGIFNVTRCYRVSKVLADQIGLPCTLTRGDYGRHWNEVTIATKHPRCHIVDLMTSGSRLLEVGSPLAEQYCHL